WQACWGPAIRAAPGTQIELHVHFNSQHRRADEYGCLGSKRSGAPSAKDSPLAQRHGKPAGGELFARPQAPKLNFTFISILSIGGQMSMGAWGRSAAEPPAQRTLHLHNVMASLLGASYSLDPRHPN